MKSIMYERYLSPWEQTVRTAVLGGFAVIMILFFFLGTVIEDRLELATDKTDSTDMLSSGPSVLGAKDEVKASAGLLFRDYGDGSASLKLDIQNNELPIFADLILYVDGDVELVSGDCIPIDSCTISIEDRFVKISLRGYRSEYSTRDDLGYVDLVNLQYEQSTGGMLVLDNSNGNFSYMMEQGQDENLLLARKYEFPIGTYFK